MCVYCIPYMHLTLLVLFLLTKINHLKNKKEEVLHSNSILLDGKMLSKRITKYFVMLDLIIINWCNVHTD